jgi:membrane protease YdiL (CAAX protease family)
MNHKQIITLLAPILILITMYPTFQLLSTRLGETWGWYLGLTLYWVTWGLIFPLLMIGKGSILELLRPQPVTWKLAGLVLFPVVMAVVFKFATGTEYQKHAPWVLLLYLSTTLGNGLFEEILWRGTYLELFPDQAVFRILWSSVWFGLWHYAPGSVSSTGNPLGLMLGSGFMGLYLGWLANWTGSIWWTALAHFLGGILMVI